MAKQKLPKRLAGIKIPKTLRRSGKRFLKHLNRGGGIELLAEALIAAGTALMASRKGRRAVAGAGQGLAHGLKEGGNALAEAVGGEKSKKDKKLGQKPYAVRDSDPSRH